MGKERGPQSLSTYELMCNIVHISNWACSREERLMCTILHISRPLEPIWHRAYDADNGRPAANRATRGADGNAIELGFRC